MDKISLLHPIPLLISPAISRYLSFRMRS